MPGDVSPKPLLSCHPAPPSPNPAPATRRTRSQRMGPRTCTLDIDILYHAARGWMAPKFCHRAGFHTLTGLQASTPAGSWRGGSPCPAPTASKPIPNFAAGKLSPHLQPGAMNEWDYEPVTWSCIETTLLSLRDDGQ